MNDIRIKVRGKTNTDSACGALVLPRIANEINFNKIKEKFSPIVEKIKEKELINPNRRNFLRIVAASGGVFIAGSLLNKVSKLNGLSLGGEGANALGSIFSSKVDTSIKTQDADDLNSFFENFRIVKNDNEYILYNKEGDNILIIDRDA